MIFKRKKNKEKLRQIRNVAEALLPIRRTYEDGVFLLTDGRYAKTYQIADVNYSTASEDSKEDILIKYGKVLNQLHSTGEPFKITVISKRLDQVADMNSLKLKLMDDDQDDLRVEYNKYLERITMGSSSYVQEIYLTKTCSKLKIKEVQTFFNRVEGELQKVFNELSTSITPINEFQKLELIYSFYKPDSGPFEYNREETMRKGESYAELVCPDGIRSEKNYYRMDNKYVQSMLITSFPRYLSDALVVKLADIGTDVAISIDVKSISKEDAIKEAERKSLDVEANIEQRNEKKRARGDYSPDPSYEMKMQREAVQEVMHDLIKRDMNMFEVTVTLTHTADTVEQLKANEDTIVAIAAGRKTKIEPLKLPSRQYKGTVTSLPFGVNQVPFDRTLMTEGLSMLNPFKIQDVIHRQGIPFGINKISRNLIVIDRTKLKNGNSLIMGKPGGGKSFAAKQQMEFVKLAKPDIDIIIVDPEREYGALAKRFHGEVINISSSSPNHINAMDINAAYADPETMENPILAKSEFVLSVFEQILKDGISGRHRSIIDRCVKNVFEPYIKNNYQGACPTFADLAQELEKVDDSDIARATAESLRLESEIFTSGSLNTFAKPTNVNTHNKFLVFDLKDLSEQLMPIGMLVVLDSILNRVSENRKKGITTYIFIDELYLFFRLKHSAVFFCNLWKRIRKYNGYCIGITQNVDDILKSEDARSLISNSEFVMMLAQSTSDRNQLAELLLLSDEEVKYITESPQGEGLIHIGDKNIPFVNRFTEDMEMYKLNNTKGGEFR